MLVSTLSSSQIPPYPREGPRWRIISYTATDNPYKQDRAHASFPAPLPQRRRFLFQNRRAGSSQGRALQGTGERLFLMKAVVSNREGVQMVTRMLTPVSLRGGGGTGKSEHLTPPLKAPAMRLCTHPEVKPEMDSAY